MTFNEKKIQDTIRLLELQKRLVVSTMLRELLQEIEEREKEKCELLGIVQKKDELIQKMKNCRNCKYWNVPHELCVYSMGDKEHYCRLRQWELAE